MNRAGNWIEKNREKVWFSIFINALILLVYLFLFRPVYETNDDMGICNIVNGVTGTNDPHLVYSNYLLGLLLSVCYRVMPGITWFPVLQYAALFLSFTAITYVVIRKMKNSSSVWIVAVVICFFSYEGYIKLQYTKTAGIVSAAGLFLLLYAVECEKISRGALLGGSLLACTGFMYRKNQFFAEAALMTGIAVVLLFRLRKSGAQKWKRLARYIGSAVFLLVLLGGLELLDRAAYSSEQWQDYTAFNEARTELFDYGSPKYSDNEEAYNALGIDKTACSLYRSNNYMDTEKFTTEVMEQLISLKTPKAFNRAFLSDFFQEFPVKFFTIPSFYCFLLIAVYWLLWGEHRLTDFVTLLYEAAIVGCLYLYLYYEGRYLYNRVDVGIWLAVILVVLWLFDSGKCFFSNRIGLALFLSVFCVFQFTWQKHWRINTTDTVAKRQEYREVITTINSDQDHLYLKKAGLISFYKSYGVFEPIPAGACNNMYTLGGWAARTTSYMGILERYGIENPYRDMIGNEKVYLIDDDIDLTMDYIHTYYDEKAEAVLVSEIGSLKIYQIKA